MTEDKLPAVYVQYTLCAAHEPNPEVNSIYLVFLLFWGACCTDAVVRRAGGDPDLGRPARWEDLTLVLAELGPLCCFLVDLLPQLLPLATHEHIANLPPHQGPPGSNQPPHEQDREAVERIVRAAGRGSFQS